MYFSMSDKLKTLRSNAINASNSRTNLHSGGYAGYIDFVGILNFSMY